jgi:hypothetical protein
MNSFSNELDDFETAVHLVISAATLHIPESFKPSSLRTPIHHSHMSSSNPSGNARLASRISHRVDSKANICSHRFLLIWDCYFFEFSLSTPFVCLFLHSFASHSFTRWEERRTLVRCRKRKKNYPGNLFSSGRREKPIINKSCISQLSSEGLKKKNFREWNSHRAQKSELSCEKSSCLIYSEKSIKIYLLEAFFCECMIISEPREEVIEIKCESRKPSRASTK